MKFGQLHPCKECPWRLAAAAGWLGGITPEFYTDAVTANEVPACHLKDFGPGDKKTAFCVGSLAVMANACIAPHQSEGGEAARKVIGKRADCFKHPRDFYKHHAKKDYVHPLFRSSQ